MGGGRGSSVLFAPSCYSTRSPILQSPLRSLSPLAISHLPLALAHSPATRCHSPFALLSPPSSTTQSQSTRHTTTTGRYDGQPHVT